MAASPIGFNPFSSITGTGPSGGASERASIKMFGEHGLTFGDLIDTFNPLHHVPILGSVYRKISGDVIGPVARLAGGALFGGPVGAALAVITTAVEHARSATPGETEPPDVRNLAQESNRKPTAGTAAALAERSPGRGGWMVNAARGKAYAGAAATEDRLAYTISPRPVDNALTQIRPGASRPRPGGWIVNAAYAQSDAAGQRPDAAVPDDRRIEVSV